jgi:hypothetical protein
LTPHPEKTIRNLMAAGELRAGEYYYKRRGRVIFSLTVARGLSQTPATRTGLGSLDEVERAVIEPGGYDLVHRQEADR